MNLLDELERLDKARPEHWHTWDRGVGYEVHIGDTCIQEARCKWSEAKPKPWEKDTRGPAPEGYCEDVNSEFRETWPKELAELAVAARNALPTLIALLKDARELATAITWFIRHDDPLALKARALLAKLEAK